MIRTTRDVIEVRCKNCDIVHLLGETFNGKHCCDNPQPVYIGERTVVEYKKTLEEEKAEIYAEMTMTDKMPDEIYAWPDADFSHEGDYSSDPDVTEIIPTYTYISEQKHAEEIAALKAEHRAEMAVLYGLAEAWEKEGDFLNAPDDHPTDKAAGRAYKQCAKQLTELIKQRISE